MAESLMDLKVGKVVKIKDDPYVIVRSEFNRKQQRKPVMRTKLRNLKNNSVLEKTFLSGEAFEFADIKTQKIQFLYKTATEAFFMNEQTFEQFEMPLEMIEGVVPYLQDGITVDGVFYEDHMISISVPPKMVFKVIETTPGVKGDTATGGTKAATLETGLVVNVPLFVNEGDKVRVNTETGEYVERAN